MEKKILNSCWFNFSLVSTFSPKFSCSIPAEKGNRETDIPGSYGDGYAIPNEEIEFTAALWKGK